MKLPMFLHIDPIRWPWVAEYDFSISTGELRILSEGRLPGQDGGDLGATMPIAEKPSVEKEEETSGRQLRDAQI